MQRIIKFNFQGLKYPRQKKLRNIILYQIKMLSSNIEDKIKILKENVSDPTNENQYKDEEPNLKSMFKNIRETKPTVASTYFKIDDNNNKDSVAENSNDNSSHDSLSIIGKKIQIKKNQEMFPHYEINMSSKNDINQNNSNNEPSSTELSLIQNSIQKSAVTCDQRNLDLYDKFNEYKLASLMLNDVPGPKPLKTYAKIWNFIPFIGEQLSIVLHKGIFHSIENRLQDQLKIKPSEYFFKKYGTIVHLPGIFGGNLIMLNRPEHMEIVFLQDDKLLQSSYIDCLEKYRQQFYFNNNRKFNEISSQLKKNTILSAIENPSESIFNRLELCSDEIITKISQIKNQRDEIPNDFWSEIRKWSLECAGHYLFSKRFGFFESLREVIPKTEAIQLHDGLDNISQAIENCEKGLQFWRIINTPSWMKLLNNMKIIDRITSQYILKAQKNIQEMQCNSTGTTENSEALPIIENLLISESYDFNKVKTILTDMLILGINSISTAIAFTLYNLAINVREQMQLKNEIDTHVPSKDTIITHDILNNMKFLKACILESLRLNPPLPYLCRLTKQDIEVNKFMIPKGTYIIMANRVACLREENFIDANKFKPNRWLVNETNNINQYNIHPFAMLPFGYGKQSCVGKKLAEIQLSLIVAKILKNYTIEYHYGDIKSTNSYLSKPSKPLKFKFIDRI